MRHALAVTCLLLAACSSTPPAPPDGGGDGGACPGAKLNVDNLNCGACGVACGTDTRCGAGQCLPADCSGAACEPFQVCSAQRCADRACLGVSCASGLSCANGQCKPADCATATCAADEVCSEGACVFTACVGVLCPSGEACARGLCVAASCGDHLRSGNETGVDCGGSCAGCPTGAACSTAADCLSRACVAGTCATAPACNDQVLSGNETDVDCGGGSCSGCAAGQGCRASTDCLSQTCTGGTCAAGGTGGGTGGSGGGTGGGGGGTGGSGGGGTGGGGGSCSPNCPFNAECLTGVDCASGICVGMKCQAARCSDLTKNGKETDVDCGGTGCPVCGNDAGCLLDSDCLSKVCFAGTQRCSFPSCTDGVRNGAELGVDCGGTCASSCGLSAALNYPVGPNPTCVGTGDFNGDGRLDLVVASATDKTLGMMRGNGDGTFQTPVAWASGESCNILKVVDLGRDGRLDVVLGTNTNASLQSLHVVLGNGNGTLQGPVPYSVSGNAPTTWLDSADFTGDGVADLVVNGGAAPSVFLGRDGGAVVRVADLNYTGSACAAAADFTGDGLVDVVSSNAAGGGLYANFSLSRGQGDGGFAASVRLADPAPSIGTEFRGLLHGDLDSDGDDDLVFVNYIAPGSAWVMLSNANGTFGGYAQYPAGPGSTPRGPTHGVVKDLNGDGQLDVVFSNSLTAEVAVFLGSGNGTLQSPLLFPAQAGCRMVAVGDFNGDSRPDVACANSGANSVSVLLNTF